MAPTHPRLRAEAGDRAQVHPGSAHGGEPRARLVKPAPFTYHRPTTVAEATALLAEHGDEAKVLAGGQSLVPMLALRLARFEHLVDLNFVPELVGVSANGSLVIGAMTRQA